MKNVVSVSAASLALCLSACGGGGSDSNASNTSGLSELSGRWITNCTSSSDAVMEASTKKMMSLTYEVDWRVVDGKLAGTLSTNIHSETDCSDAPLAQHKATLQAISEGNVSVNDGKSAVKAVVTISPVLSAFNAPTITLNGLTYLNENGTWTSPRNYKDLYFSDGRYLYVGDISLENGADGYPVALDLETEDRLTKAD